MLISGKSITAMQQQFLRKGPRALQKGFVVGALDRQTMAGSERSIHATLVSSYYTEMDLLRVMFRIPAFSSRAFLTIYCNDYF